MSAKFKSELFKADVDFSFVLLRVDVKRARRR